MPFYENCLPIAYQGRTGLTPKFKVIYSFIELPCNIVAYIVWKCNILSINPHYWPCIVLKGIQNPNLLILWIFFVHTEQIQEIPEGLNLIGSFSKCNIFSHTNWILVVPNWLWIILEVLFSFLGSIVRRNQHVTTKIHRNILNIAASNPTSSSHHIQICKIQRIIYFYLMVEFDWDQLGCGSFFTFYFNLGVLLYVWRCALCYYIIIFFSIGTHYYSYW